MHFPSRRIVTGLDAQGRSTVFIDDNSGFEAGGGGNDAMLLWQSREMPPSNEGNADAAQEGFAFPLSKGATQCLLFDMAPSDDLAPPGMHLTDTLDYIAIMRGAVTLYLEDGEVDAVAGDIVIDRGVIHGWRNKGPDHARMLVVIIGAEPLDGNAKAHA